MSKPHFKTALGPKSYLDDRNDLGLGRLQPKYFKNKKGASTFPYIEEPEDVSDVDIDDETLDAANWKTVAPQGMDPLAKKGTNPFSFVGGNTKLGEGTTVGLSPFPGMYKNNYDTATGGKLRGVTARHDGSTEASLFDWGDETGWSSMASLIDEEPENDCDSAYTLEDIGEKNLRECIRRYIIEYWRYNV